MKAVIIFCTLFIICPRSFAQLKNSPYEVGIHLGASLYAGDLTPAFFSSYRSPGLFFGLDGIKKISDIFSIRGSLSFGKLKADDADFSKPAFRQQRNFNFKTSVTELSASAILNPLGTRILTPYIFAGAGLSFIKVRRDYSLLDAEYFSNDPAITEGLPLDIAQSLPGVIAVLPVGAGIRYALTGKLSINVETAYRFMSNDYLDGFSLSADPGKKDHYFTHTIGIVYSFGNKNMLACPKNKR